MRTERGTLSHRQVEQALRALPCDQATPVFGVSVVRHADGFVVGPGAAAAGRLRGPSRPPVLSWVVRGACGPIRWSAGVK
jgi:hypothetical protein